MNYNIDFEICSLIFLIPFGIMGISKKVIPNKQNFYFSLLVFFIISSSFIEITAVILSQNYSNWTIYLLYYCHHILNALATLLFYLYMDALTKKNAIFDKKNYLIFLPCFITTIFILISPFTNTIFYLNNGKYIQGNFHFILAVNFIIYFIFSLFVFFKRIKNIDQKTIFYLFIFLLLLLIAHVIEINDPRYLLINPAISLGLILLYISLQTPNHYIDKNTQLFNHNTVIPLTKKLYDSKTEFHFLILIIDEFITISSILGVKSIELLLNQITKFLKETFKDGYILRLKNDQFGIICYDNIVDTTSLNSLHQLFPTVWTINETDIKITTSFIGLSSRDYKYAESFINTISYAINIPNIANDTLLYLDKKANNDILYKYKVETILKTAIDNGTIEVYYQPIYNNEKKRFTNLEALARLYDPELGFIPPNTFIQIAEQNGMISKLGQIVIEKVCMLLKMNDLKNLGIDCVQINLSVVQCMEVKLHKDIFKIIDKYELPYDMFCFEVTETAASTSFNNLLYNMTNISKKGIKFALDDYGMGYSNIDYLIKLPFNFLKIDKNILWSALDNNKSEISFECIKYTANKLDLTIISEGAEKESHIAFLKKMNINLIQGFYYSKPLPYNTLIDFLNKVKTDN